MQIKSLSTAIAIAASCICACTNNTEMGNYGQDLSFFKAQGIDIVELSEGDARVLVVPGWQARVMTSSAGGDDGTSYGWINKGYIAAGEISAQFNPFGGEERLWLGPEGGPFSWYFHEGDEQVYANWDVPAALDTEAFSLDSRDDCSAAFSRVVEMENASGRLFNIGIKRKIRMVGRKELSEELGVDLPQGLKVVAYRTENTLSNEGEFEWTKETGMPSIWLLGMFAPTPTTTVFIPFDKGCPGKPVKDDYFGPIPSDRLKLKDGVAYFRIDGKFRAKLGLPQGSAKGLCGSYDSKNLILNILKYTIPEGECDYVNSQWGDQESNFGGDVINSYNDGPTETGTVMGPFYEIETSSPAAALGPGESLTHSQLTIHIEGDREMLAAVAEAVFGVALDGIENVFK